MLTSELKIVIVGIGNVGTNLMHALQGKSKVIAIRGRGDDTIPDDADFYILTVPDKAISEVCGRIPETTAGIIMHTSGSTPLSVLSGRKRYGVLYPLQTFTKDVTVDFSGLDIFIEASDDTVLRHIRELALLLSPNIRYADSDIRLKLHIAAVFACNFTCRMLTHADRILRQCGYDISALRPLIRETIDKAMTIGPEKAQTGPARRHDEVTIMRHLEILSDNPGLKKLFTIVSNDILKDYTK